MKEAIHNLANGKTICLECLGLTLNEALEMVYGQPDDAPVFPDKPHYQRTDYIVITKTLRDLDGRTGECALFPYGEECIDCNETVLEPTVEVIP